MTQYVQISEAQMDAFMAEHGYREIPDLPGVKEKVYGKVIAQNLCLRVYSTIDNGVGRKRGSDAIRTVLVTRLENGDIKAVGTTAKVLRIETWKKNLLNRLNTWNEQLGPICPKCSNHTVARNGKWGLFYGCVTFPVCRGTVEDRGY